MLSPIGYFWGPPGKRASRQITKDLLLVCLLLPDFHREKVATSSKKGKQRRTATERGDLLAPLGNNTGRFKGSFKND